jgi:hypothetical protein
MAHYSIFVPGAIGASTQPLIDAGLGDLVAEGDRKPDTIEVSQGPNGHRGTVYGWTITAGTTVPLGIFPEVKWIPSYDEKFWLGINEQDRPKPIDLLRHSPINGTQVTLADGYNWNLPTISRLPANFALDESGMLTRTVKERYKRLYDSSVNVVSDLLRQFGMVEMLREQNKKLEDYSIPVSVEDGLILISNALSINYRLTFTISMMLGLFDESTAAMSLISLCELREIRLASEQKKNLEPVFIPVGWCSSSGIVD